MMAEEEDLGATWRSKTARRKGSIFNVMMISTVIGRIEWHCVR